MCLFFVLFGAPIARMFCFSFRFVSVRSAFGESELFCLVFCFLDCPLTFHAENAREAAFRLELFCLMFCFLDWASTCNAEATRVAPVQLGLFC